MNVTYDINNNLDKVKKYGNYVLLYQLLFYFKE